MKTFVGAIEYLFRVAALEGRSFSFAAWIDRGYLKRAVRSIFLVMILVLLALIDGSQNDPRLSEVALAEQIGNKMAPSTLSDNPAAVTELMLTQSVSFPDNSSANHTIYLPNIVKPSYMKFSVAGGRDEEQELHVVPLGSQIDPYVWDVLPDTRTSIQVIRSCTYYRDRVYLLNPARFLFYDYYDDSRTHIGQICWDPVTEKVAQLVYVPGCPYYNPELAEENLPASPQARAELESQRKLCLDVEHDSIPNNGETLFRGYVRDNPSWIWLVGNEPDGLTQDAMIDHILIGKTDNDAALEPMGGPESYAKFFKNIYDIVDEESPHNARLVFCQASFAWDMVNLPNNGTGYCRQAFEHLQDLGYGADQIYALSVHQYLPDTVLFHGIHYWLGRLLNGEDKPFPGDDQPAIGHGIDKWIGNLQDFEEWAASAGMGDKPLWLTEFGALQAWCYEVQDSKLRPGIDQEGGLPCSEAGKGNSFYGRNNGEGIWGLQTKQIEYLARRDNNWAAAWWFISRMGDWNGNGVCDQSAWLWGGDEDCRDPSTRPNGVSRAGETYFQAIDWVINGRSPAVPITASD